MPSVKQARRRRIRYRVRNKVRGTAVRPRLSVYRSNKGIYCQLIDDVHGHTLVQASSLELSDADNNKSDQAKEVGKLLAKRGKDVQVETIVFDRGGYLYHGRVKSLAEGVREGGLVF